MTDRVVFTIRRPRQVALYERVERVAADAHGVEPDELSRPELFEAIAEVYLDVARLRQDQRYQHTAEAIAADHGMNPDELTWGAAVRTSLACYNGFNSGLGWPDGQEG